MLRFLEIAIWISSVLTTTATRPIYRVQAKLQKANVSKIIHIF